MIIFWKGQGIFALIVPLVCVMVTQLIADGVSGNPHFYETHHWLAGIAILIAAVPVYLIGHRLNRLEGRGDSLFLIPMDYCAIILSAIGFCFLFANL